MKPETIILSIVFIPLAGSILLPLAGRISEKLRNLLALLFISASFLLSLKLIPQALSGQEVLISGNFIPGLQFLFLLDPLAVFMSCVSSFISAIIILYSFGYISHYKNQGEYYFLVVLFLGAMMGLVFSANLILLYVFWEITAITSWRLIGFFRERDYVLKADKAFLVTAFGALAMLLGFVSIYQQAGSFDLPTLKGTALTTFAVVLILCGILSKSATLPFHTWLPDAGVAPSPVTALLHAAILVKIGVYVFARLFVATFTLEQFWHTVVPLVALGSALISAGAALVDNDIKRIIAYSTVSQIGFIFFGLSTGNEIGIIGGLLYILMHGLSKAGLFLCAGIIEQNTKMKDIARMGGLIRTMPFTAAAFLLCAFSVMGIPPLGGFWSKYLVFNGAVNAGQVWVSFAYLLGAVLTILYLLRLFNMVFMGEAKLSQAVEGSSVMVFSVVLLGVLSLLAGVFINYSFDFARIAAQQMLVMVK